MLLAKLVRSEFIVVRVEWKVNLRRAIQSRPNFYF